MKWGAEDYEGRIIINTRVIIQRETLARSRGHGLLAGNEHVIISACKGYVQMRCKDHNKTVPDDTSLNKAATLHSK
ncbi:hypothetical protein DPMN_038434 [Dreissena polymorpha]|uniref:Uncharacterized protein n=2 Tax=Dreissena polymorpha TaxID=45954 RepID=A0A9D4MH28_DREPO|nr:hypothetical protein DPMN_038434 [Dreissena polymorpha]